VAQLVEQLIRNQILRVKKAPIYKEFLKIISAFYRNLTATLKKG
jgi:hypothetical protein